MPLLALDHVNILTTDLPGMITWYSDVLGLKSGDRPPFTSLGAWMYLGDDPIVHLVGVEKDPQNIHPRIEHFALRGTQLPAFLDRLKAHDVAHTVDAVPARPFVQVNLRDCDGNHIHVDFSIEAEDAPAPA